MGKYWWPVTRVFAAVALIIYLFVLYAKIDALQSDVDDIQNTVNDIQSNMPG